jgi:uncharacterized protein (TIGR03663 family)
MTKVPSKVNSVRKSTDRWLNIRINLNAEILAYCFLILLAVGSRFYDLETRVMSHDESQVTWLAWEFSNGRSYEHDPLLHGPVQFQLVGLSYLLFGDSDASSRYPAALAGVIAIGMVALFRKWLGRWGALSAAALMLISPYMLFYSRYVRNEALIVVEALLMFYAVVRYFEDQKPRYLYLLVASLSLHLATKETAYIYSTQLLIFLAAVFIWNCYQKKWTTPSHRLTFTFGWITGAIGFFITLFMLVRQPAVSVAMGASIPYSPMVVVSLGLTLIGIVIVGVVVVRTFGRRLREEFPALDLLVVSGTMLLPQISALLLILLGVNPINLQAPGLLPRAILILISLLVISGVIGFIWGWKRWLVAAAIFYGIFVITYMGSFTYPISLLSGLLRSLGYWLTQHGIAHGEQPGYYYALVQIPIYEFLIALGMLAALGLRFSKWREKLSSVEVSKAKRKFEFPVIDFLLYWGLTSLLIYSVAGERMPWLTVHIILPMILVAGWAFVELLHSFEWNVFRTFQGWLIPALIIISIMGFTAAVGVWLGSGALLQGGGLAQLRLIGSFISALIIGVAALITLSRVAQDWTLESLGRLSSVVVFGIMGSLTARAAYRAAYLFYDEPTELLVYAHSATGVKTVMNQVEELSIRTTGGSNIEVAFDRDVAWPLNWYLRNYPNRVFLGESLFRSNLESPILIIGDDNWSTMDDLLGDRYFQLEHTRLWWPTQAYANLTWEGIFTALRSVEMRSALWEIWLNRNYTPYGQIVETDFSLQNWQPSDRMKLYIRKDISTSVWDKGVSPISLEELRLQMDPYASGTVELKAGIVFGEQGALPGQFIGPRGLAVAPDGTIFVADTRNHRIQHLSAEGEVLHIWGEFANLDQGEAPGGTFNEPWGIDVGPDGRVYVADTWNHRVQYFTEEGQFIGMFGTFGYPIDPTNFWGPRDIAVDSEGRVYVADTGNKRIAIFTSDGIPLGSFGVKGSALGELEEPVGLAIDSSGLVYVADTWNRRIQAFKEGEEGDFQAIKSWPLNAWYGESLDNKPYLDFGPDDQVCATLPEGFRVLCFTKDGDFILGWGDYGDTDWLFGVLGGIAFDEIGNVWVVDSGNSRIMRFTMP